MNLHRIILLCLTLTLTACAIEEKPIMASDFYDEKIHAFTIGSEIDRENHNYLFHFTTQLKFPLETRGTRVESYTGFVPEYILLKEVTESGDIIRDIGTLEPVIKDEKEFHFDRNRYMELVTFEGKHTLPLSEKNQRHVIFVIEKNGTLHSSEPQSFDYTRFSLEHKRHITLKEEGPRPLPPSLWQQEESNIFQVSIDPRDILEYDGRVPMNASLEEITKEGAFIQKIADIGLEGGSFSTIYTRDIELTPDGKDIRYFRAVVQRVTGESAQSDPVMLRQGIHIIPTTIESPTYTAEPVREEHSYFQPEVVAVCFEPSTPSARIAEILQEQQIKAIPPLSQRSYNLDESCSFFLAYNPRLQTGEDTIQFSQSLMHYKEIPAAGPNFYETITPILW